MIAVAIILNGISRKKNKFYSKIYPALVEKFSVEIFETKWAGHARELGREAAALGVDVILAAGGDGTLNQVLNGMLAADAGTSLPALGVIPLGTANDFARTCRLKPSPAEIIGLLETHSLKPADIGKVVCHDENGIAVTRFFINACSLGMGPEVVRRVEEGSRRWGPSLVYLKAIVTTFLQHRPVFVTCETPAWKWSGKARVLAIANGRSFGHALYIAPDAKPDDGCFNTFIAGDIPLWRFLVYLQAIKAAKKIQHQNVFYNTAVQAELRASELCALEADGEQIGFLPANIDVVPNRINFLY